MNYGAADIQKLLGLTRAQLHTLILAGITNPIVASTGKGVSNEYCYADLREMRILESFIRRHRPIKEIKSVVDKLRATDAWWNYHILIVKTYMEKDSVDVALCEAHSFTGHLDHSIAEYLVVNIEFLLLDLNEKIKKLNPTPRGRKPH